MRDKACRWCGGQVGEDRGRSAFCGEGCRVERRRERGRIGSKKWREKNPAMAQKVARRWEQKNPEKKRKMRRRYRRDNMDKRAVHRAINKAVRRGKLSRPDRCSNCGSGGKIHAHHEDYSRRFDVVWLCPLCHAGVHRGRIKLEAIS